MHTDNRKRIPKDAEANISTVQNNNVYGGIKGPVNFGENLTMGDYIDQSDHSQEQNIDASTKRNLDEAAREIQDLLDHLSDTYPSRIVPVTATKAIEEIEKNPELKERIIGALKSGGTEALKELIHHPAVSIVLAAIEGWQEPDS